MIALGDFWLLHGFKQADAIDHTLSDIPQFRSLRDVFHDNGLKGLYTHFMQLTQQEVDALLIPVVQKELRRRSFHESEKNEPGYWVAEYYLNRAIKNVDRGIFSVYLFNIVHLTKGEGIFQAAGVPHAYLKGQNVELMSNSDNVVRGGLTTKNIDVNEFVRLTMFESIKPEIIPPSAFVYGSSRSLPVPDFGIQALSLRKGEQIAFEANAPEICICMEGAATAGSGDTEIRRGEAFIAFAGTNYTIKAIEDALLFRAVVP